MNIIVTGANGFIGKKIIKRFNNKKNTVWGWDLISNVVDNVKIDYVDINNIESTSAILESFEPDLIIHCAGSADVGKSVENPNLDFDSNVKLTHSLLFCMKKAKLNKTRFVFLSSAGVYGNPFELPIKEESLLCPLSPYALHKVMCEDICKYFIKEHGFNIKIARIFSAYGDGLRKQIFWDMNIKYNNTGKLELLGSGNESRDYIYIDDVIECIYLIANTKSDLVVFNVANGEEVKIKEVAAIFADLWEIDKKLVSFSGKIREGDPINWCADISRIKEIGYRKSVDIRNGLMKYHRWINSLH